MRTILLIDDERAALDMLGLFLEAYGFVVSPRKTGEGAGAVPAETTGNRHDRHQNAGMDGLEVLRQLKQINPDTEVIVFTGHGDLDLAVKALNLNATDFIHKPIQKKFLESALRRAEERLSSCTQGDCNVRVLMENGVLILEVDGNITARSQGPLTEAMQRIGETGEKILLCLDEKAAINGAGLALLSTLLLEHFEKGEKMLLTGVTHNFQRVFSMIGITRFAQIVPDRQAAFTLFQNS